MKPNTRRVLFWSPRIMCFLFALFLSLFALDVFSEGYGLWGTILALLIHLVPTFIVVIVIAVAWRWELIGALLFIALGLFYMVWVWGKFPWVTYLAISGPLFLVGALFLVNWVHREELRSK